jgi:hypothetical protein
MSARGILEILVGKSIDFGSSELGKFVLIVGNSKIALV